MFDRWGKKKCNCKDSDNCKMRCAAITWAFGDTVCDFVFRRAAGGLVHGGVRDARLSFVHFLQWDPQSRRPIALESCQPTCLTNDLVSRCLATRQSTLPSILSGYCKHRGEHSIPKMEKQIRDMSDQLRYQQLEVFNIIFNLFVIYHLFLFFIH